MLKGEEDASISAFPEARDRPELSPIVGARSLNTDLVNSAVMPAPPKLAQKKNLTTIKSKLMVNIGGLSKGGQETTSSPLEFVDAIHANIVRAG